MRVRTESIKGAPIYLFQGTQYVVKPEGTIIKSMKYDEDENITYVKCKKPSILGDLLCLIVIIMCMLVNWYCLTQYQLSVDYNSICTYFDGRLYVNLANNSTTSITYELVGTDGIVQHDVLKPGEKVYIVGVENVESEYELVFRSMMLFIVYEESVTIHVTDRSSYEDD